MRSSSGRPASVAPQNTDGFAPLDWALFLGMSLLWGSSFLFIAMGLESFGPGLVTWLRVGLGALALAVLPGQRLDLEPSDRMRVLAVSVGWVGLPFSLFPLAQQHINSALTGLLNGGTPLFTATIGALFFGTRVGRNQQLGIAIGFIGILLISLPSLTTGGGADHTGNEPLGVALVLLATLCYGVSMNLAAPLQQKYGSVPLMARLLVLATIWTAPAGLWQLRDAEPRLAPVLAVATVGVVGTGIAFGVMATLVGRVGPTRASFITYLIPGVALVLGVVFRDDRVAPLALVGVALVCLGAILASRRT